jgi:hypothetical protein
MSAGRLFAFSSVRRGVGAALAVGCCLALVPAVAQAGQGGSATPTFPTDLTVGQTGLPASLVLKNESTFPQNVGTSTICNFGDGGQFCGSDRGITLIPSCARFDSSLRTCDAPDPGVFRLSPTAVGAAGSGCQGQMFDVTEVDAALGLVRFTPQGGAHVTLASGATCQIDFTVAILKLPATDADPNRLGTQTNQLGSARFVSNVDMTPGQATGTAFGKTVKPPCTPPPGKPPAGGEQCAPPPPCTPPPGSPPPGGVLCAPTPPPIVPGPTPGAPPLARIKGQTGCVTKNFNVTVTGMMIRRVVYTLDGRRVATLSRPNRGSAFVFRVKPGTLKRGVHRIVARTTFTSASGAQPRDLRVSFSRCSRARRVPAFTG